jgi:hypothetical protein
MVIAIFDLLSVVVKYGMEGLRTQFERNSTHHSWYGLKKKLNGLSVTSHMKYNSVRFAQQHLEDFSPLKLQDYKERMTANGIFVYK